MDSQKTPYQSPQAIDIAASLQHERWVRPYGSGHARAMWVMSLLAMTIVVLFLLLGCLVIEIQSMRQILHGTPDEFDSALHSLNLIRRGPIKNSLIILFAAVVLATPIAFLMWIHRVHRNLPALGAERLKYSPGWAVGYFFIPILNVFRPYQVMREIWRESDPARLPVRGQASGATKASSAAIVGWWWASFLLVHIVNQAARPFCDTSTPHGLLTALWISLPIILLAIEAGIVAMVMVYRVDSHQSQRHVIVLRQLDTPKTFPPGTADDGPLH